MTLNIIAQLLADIAAWPSTLVDRLHMFSLKKRDFFDKYLQDYQFPPDLADQKFRNHVSLTRKNFRMDMGCEKSFNIFPFIRVGFQLFTASVFLPNVLILQPSYFHCIKILLQFCCRLKIVTCRTSWTKLCF